MKKDKNLIKMLEGILLGDYSDALQNQVSNCLKVYNNIKTYEEMEVFYEQFE